MALGHDSGAVSQPSPVSQPRRTPETPEERHARRVAWGKQAGAKIAAAYRERTEAL